MSTSSCSLRFEDLRTALSVFARDTRLPSKSSHSVCPLRDRRSTQPLDTNGNNEEQRKLVAAVRNEIKPFCGLRTQSDSDAQTIVSTHVLVRTQHWCDKRERIANIDACVSSSTRGVCSLKVCIVHHKQNKDMTNGTLIFFAQRLNVTAPLCLTCRTPREVCLTICPSRRHPHRKGCGGDWQH